MMYVDLNPIRAKLAKSLEKSEYTSIAERIGQDCNHMTCKGKDSNRSENKPAVDNAPNNIRLFPFLGVETGDESLKGIPFDFKDYGRRFKGVVGSIEAIKKFSLLVGRRWIHGIKPSLELYQQSFDP